MEEVKRDRARRGNPRAPVRHRRHGGQDAVNSARAFGAALDLTGVILTKADGDARGGAALSVREVTGKPIVLVGVGEKLDALEPFDAERMAGRILGMGDVVALVEQVQKQVNVEEAQKLAKKVAKARVSTWSISRASSNSCRKWAVSGAHGQAAPGRHAGAPLPPIRATRTSPADRHHQFHDRKGTPQSGPAGWLAPPAHRRRRGVQVQDVNKLMKQFMEMQKMMKSMGGGRMKRMLQAFKGGMPPAFPGRSGAGSVLGCTHPRLAAPRKHFARHRSQKPFTKSPVCVESALFFGRPGRVIRPGATQLEGSMTW
jgi:signal recognition particle subunit SRP54